MKKIYFIIVMVALISYGCDKGTKKGDEGKDRFKPQSGESAQEAALLKQAQTLFAALPENADNPDNPVTAPKVKLGKVLYFDNRLSKDQTQSCNTCHNLSAFGVDNESFSEGDDGSMGDRNSPTVLNAALHSTQFWDGRAKDVEEQAGLPVLNPVEMAIPSEKFLVDRLSGVKMYQDMFAAAFPESKKPLTYENIRLAIAAFERTLLTPSKWDDYLKGNTAALSEQEQKGLETFISVGCITCHTGSLIGGNMFQKFGLFGNYWELTGSENIDLGRMKETNNEMDKYMFKVPSLRNIAKTWPYFHDGSVKDLKEAAVIMAKLGLNKDLTEEQADDIVIFLNALTGDLPEDVKKAPAELTM